MGALAFALAVAAVLALWAGLFALIGRPAFGTLCAMGWFAATVGGGALALGISLLRDRAATMAALRRELTTFLGPLAPVLAAPLLLANAVIAGSETDVPRAPALRLSATALGAAMLPLGVVAAVSQGQRIAQHGWSPERLCAATFIGIALAWGTT